MKISKPIPKPSPSFFKSVTIYALWVVLLAILIAIFALSYLYISCKKSDELSCINWSLKNLTLSKLNNIAKTGTQIENEAAVTKSYDRVLYAAVTRGMESKIPFSSINPEEQEPGTPLDSTQDTISIGWVGDIVPVNSPTSATLATPTTESAPSLATTLATAQATEQSNKYFTNFIPFFSSLDIMSGNLEGVLTDSDTYQSKCAKMKTDCFAIKGSSNFAQTLASSGFDVLNIANNHALDFGSSGLTDTQVNLNNAGLKHTGAKGNIAYVKTEKGTVAFVGFAQNYQLNSLTDKYQIRTMIAKAREQADIVIATIHAGAEGPSSLFVPEGSEIYLGENRGNTKDLAHTMIDAGADMVLGSGPHVLRGIEIYNQKIIAYSLGNFLSVNKLSTNNFLALSGILIANIDSNKNIKSVKIIPVRISSTDGIPRFDETGASILLINHLSKENFGENGIQLDENGIYQTVVN